MDHIKQYAVKYNLPLNIVHYLADQINPLLNTDEFETQLKLLIDAIGPEGDVREYPS